MLRASTNDALTRLNGNDFPAQPGGGQRVFFFLSYAREDDPVFIRRFFHDLSEQVRSLAGVGQSDVVGFLDEANVQIGQGWSDEMTSALGTCKCFVAMTSPRYFRREYCGREWYIFSDRLDLYQRQHRQAAPALLPVRWIPVDPMPPIAQRIQSANSTAASPEYLDFGLRQMLHLKRFEDDYAHFVFEFARRIVKVSREHDVPVRRKPLQLHLVPNIFAENLAAAPSTVAPPARPPRARTAGPTWRTSVHFIVVAGTRAEMASMRKKLDYYGATAAQWRPYLPGLEEPLLQRANTVAIERQITYAVADIEDLGERIDRAHQQNELVVLLVDAWSTRLAKHRNALAEYDNRDEATTAVLIPLNTADLETMGDSMVLQAELARVLDRTLARRDRVMLRQGIPTGDHFATDLAAILEVGRNRMFKKGKVNPTVPDRPSRARPILEGPTE